MLLDYEDFLRQRNLAIWPYNHSKRHEIVRNRFQTLDEFAGWINQQPGKRSENVANSAIVLISVVCNLLDRQIAKQAEMFQQEGGFTERLYRFRKMSR